MNESAIVEAFLSSEGKRNRRNADLYLDILSRAFPGIQIDVIVGHHICFEFNKDIATENEIPAADTLLFHHDIMGRVFGKLKARDIRHRICDLSAGEREDYVRQELNRLKAREQDARRNSNWEPAPQFLGLTMLDT